MLELRKNTSGRSLMYLVQNIFLAQNKLKKRSNTLGQEFFCQKILFYFKKDDNQVKLVR